MLVPRLPPVLTHDSREQHLYISMLQRLGIETDRFSSSEGTIHGLEMV